MRGWKHDRSFWRPLYRLLGATEAGETRYALNKHGYRDVYRVTDYKHPFDLYKGENVLCFDEFRSQFPISDMLNYLDGYPMTLPCRYNNKQACYNIVYIISNVPLEEQYPIFQLNQPATWQAFLRRIHHVIKFPLPNPEDEPPKQQTFDDFIEISGNEIDNPFDEKNG